MSEFIRIAVQKKGRLNEGSLRLLKSCGISFNQNSNKLSCKADNFPIEFLFLRDDDIPGYVEDGVADLGIVGENELYEKEVDVTIAKELGFSRCRLSLAVPRSFEYNGVEDLRDLGVATSYPVLTDKFLKDRGVTTEIHEISGSVEIAPNIGLAGAICDLVSSGSTLLSNGLKEVEVVMRSQAVLVANKNLSEAKTKIVEELLFRLEAVQKAKGTKYIMLNAPNTAVDEITALLPGVKSPTIVPLAMKGWSSVQSVVHEDEFWEIIEKNKNPWC